MPTPEEVTANLEVTAIVRLLAKNDQDETAKMMLTGTDDPTELARAACGIAAALVVSFFPGREDYIMDRYIQSFLTPPV